MQQLWLFIHIYLNQIFPRLFRIYDYKYVLCDFVHFVTA